MDRRPRRARLPTHRTVWREHLAERYDYLAVRLAERGSTIAAEQPEWSKQLGAVPADAERGAEWNKLAAEVDAFRGRYAIEEATPDAIPNQYQEGAIGAELQERVTAMHKSAALSKEPPADQAVRARAAEQAAAAALRARDGAQQPQTVAADKPRTVAEALRARNQAEAERASAKFRRAGRMPTTQDPTRSAARDAAKRERQRLERVRDDDARER